MRTEKLDYQVIYHFDSWGEFVDRVETGTPEVFLRDPASREASDREFYGGVSFNKAIELARVGWPEGVDKIKSKLDLLKAHIPTKVIRNEMVMQSVGPGTLDMNRYRIGHPEPWVTWQPSEQVSENIGSIITINFNISASAFVSADDMFSKGAMCCELIDLLERHGHRVELILSMGSEQIHAEILTKHSSDIVDIDRIAFATAHAASFRRLGFAMMELAPEKYLKESGVLPRRGYGRPADVVIPNALNIKSSSGYDQNYNIMGQFKWLKTQLADYGIELEQ